MKREITYRIKQAYLQSKKSSDFTLSFNHKIQELIDEYTGPDSINYGKGLKELQHFITISKTNRYSTQQYLKLIRGYVLGRIKKYRQEQK